MCSEGVDSHINYVFSKGPRGLIGKNLKIAITNNEGNIETEFGSSSIPDKFLPSSFRRNLTSSSNAANAATGQL